MLSDDGKKNFVSWTLSNYLKISHIKFPSRARLYCVRVAKGVRASIRLILFIISPYILLCRGDDGN